MGFLLQGRNLEQPLEIQAGDKTQSTISNPDPGNLTTLLFLSTGSKFTAKVESIQNCTPCFTLDFSVYLLWHSNVWMHPKSSNFKKM